MKHRDQRLFPKKVRDLCAIARSWCAKLETVSSSAGDAGLPATLARSFAPVLAGAKPGLGLRGLALLLINAIHQLATRLLEGETAHQQALAALASPRQRRDAASRDLYQRLKTFHRVGMENRCGAVIPPGGLPRRPDRVAAVAAVVRPRLDCPELKAAFGVELTPALRPSFDKTVAELAEASAAVEDGVRRSRETLDDRNAAMDELRAHIAAARSFHQAICDLRALDPAGNG